LIQDQEKLQSRGEPAPDISALTFQMAKGDEAAYRRFYELYFHRLLRYLVVLTRNEESAREALQITFLRVVRYCRKFESEEAFWSWLTVLARSSVVDEQRRAKRYFGFLARFFERGKIETEAANSQTEVQLLELLQAKVGQLPADERELIERKYFHGETVRQIAEENQTTEKAVESSLVRARKRLKQMILSQMRHES